MEREKEPYPKENIEQFASVILKNKNKKHAEDGLVKGDENSNALPSLVKPKPEAVAQVPTNWLVPVAMGTLRMLSEIELLVSASGKRC